MAIKINKPTNQRTYTYVPLEERGEEKPFKVTIRPLSTKEYTLLEDISTKINQDQTVSLTTGSFNWQVVKKTIINWENIFDESGKPIKIVIGSQGVVDDSLNLLPVSYVNEIANVVMGITRDPDNADLYLMDTSVDEEAPEEETQEDKPEADTQKKSRAKAK